MTIEINHSMVSDKNYFKAVVAIGVSGRLYTISSRALPSIEMALEDLLRPTRDAAEDISPNQHATIEVSVKAMLLDISNKEVQQ